jgi:translocation and assembly module TamB
LKLENPAAGTSLALQGGLDLGYLRRRLSVRGQLQQDLARAWSAPETFAGRGRLGVTFRVESSDLAVYHTLASMRLDGVDARFPRSGVALQAVDGEIPVSADVAVEEHGFTLLRAGESNPFSQHRFADQHPLLSRSSFLYVGSISSPAATISPLAGNLKVEQNVISLDQVEMGYRGGYVSGECVLDWEGDASTLLLHARAAGVRSSHGEPFDGNAALFLSASEHSIDGRIEILRIGSHHLLDLLDLQDPLRVDPATNRIRFALTLGYPDHARVQFDHGFASMRVAFGGLAQLVSVGELRGIPTGPLIDRALAPFSKRETQ